MQIISVEHKFNTIEWQRRWHQSKNHTDTPCSVDCSLPSYARVNEKGKTGDEAAAQEILNIKGFFLWASVTTRTPNSPPLKKKETNSLKWECLRSQIYSRLWNSVSCNSSSPTLLCIIFQQISNLIRTWVKLRNQYMNYRWKWRK